MSEIVRILPDLFPECAGCPRAVEAAKKTTGAVNTDWQPKKVTVRCSDINLEHTPNTFMGVTIIGSVNTEKSFVSYTPIGIGSCPGKQAKVK